MVDMPDPRNEEELEPEQEVLENEEERDGLESVAFEIMRADELRRLALPELQIFVEKGWKEENGMVWTKVGQVGVASLSADVKKHEFTMSIAAGESETEKVFASAEDALAWFEDLVEIVYDESNYTDLMTAMHVANERHEFRTMPWTRVSRTQAILDLRAKARLAR